MSEQTITTAGTTSAFGQALIAATEEIAPRVDIPAAVTQYLASEVTYFATRTNRYRRTLTVSAELAAGILVNRPKSERELTGEALREAGAKEFARQVRQYATDHTLSTAPSRDGNAVTFRFAKIRPAK